jgi:hypothetical protein
VGITVIQYSTTITLELPYTKVSFAAHAAAICDFLEQNATRLGGASRLDLALDAARAIFLDEGESFFREVFILTDGGIAQPAATRTAASALRILPVPARICVTNTSSNCDVGIADLKAICNTTDSDTFNPFEPVGVHGCTLLDDFEFIECTECSCASIIPVEDRIFIVDGSDSVDASDFAYQKAILRRVVCGVDAPDYATASVGIAVIQSAASSLLELPYTVIRSDAQAAAICDLLDQNMNKSSGGARLDLALNQARNVFLSDGRSSARQVFITTEGVLTDPALARTAAASLRQLTVPARICVTNTSVLCNTGISDLKAICNSLDADTFNATELIGVHSCTVQDDVTELICSDCTCRSLRIATPPRPGWADLIFVIDGSGSVEDLFTDIKATMARYVCDRVAADPSVLPFGAAVIQFADTAQVELEYRVIRTAQDASDFCDQMLLIDRLDGGTLISEGLQVAKDLIAAKAQAPVRHLLLLGDGNSGSRALDQQLANDLRAMPIPVRVCAIEISTTCNDAFWMRNLANDVFASSYDPNQPDGNFACSQGGVSSLLICDNCMCNDQCLDCCKDCNLNGISDTCELKSFVNLSSPPFSPFGIAGFLATHTFTGWPPPIDQVVLAFTANAPLAGSANVTVFLNGENLGTIFDSGSNCPIPNVDTISLPAATFTSLTPSGFATVEMRTGAFASSSACGGDTSISVVLSVATDIFGDSNDNGVVDQCEGQPGDSNLDGVVGILDFLEVLSTWGPCPDPQMCPTDFDLNGVVGIEDFLIVLANWTPS